MPGESENRNKELKREPAADRLSDHRFLANFFRLYLHAAALNLLVRLRRATAGPITFNMNDLDRNVPAEALAGRDRHTWFNGRRRNQRQRPPRPSPGPSPTNTASPAALPRPRHHR